VLASAPRTEASYPPPAYSGATTESEPVRQRPPCFDCGTIESVRQIEKKGEGSGLGAVAGGLLGGLLGHQTGGGRGRDVMTVVGAVGGAVAGHQIEKNTKKSTAYEVTVRFEDGTTRILQQANEPAWRMGDRVRVINSEIVPAS
jgi:outer membrane lipoprotein SlyB